MSNATWSRWLATLAISAGVMLEVVDTTVVNVALPQIIGSLGATLSDASWVVSGYILANVIVLPISGWLGNRFGRKRYFLASMALFTVFSLLCGTATSLGQLIAFHILQGLAGGGLMSTGQALLIEAWPAEKMGTGMTIFGIGMLFGPAIGPTLGGLVLEHMSWGWIFFMNLPVGIAGMLLVAASVHGGPGTGKAGSVDWAGIALLAASVGSLQFVLERGQADGWLDAPNIAALSVVAVLGFAFFLWRELSTEHPVVDLSIFRYRNFSLGTAGMFIVGVILNGSMVALPLFCQNILGCSPLQSGQLMFPAAIGSMLGMIASGALSRKGVPGGVLVTVGTGMIFLSLMRMGGATVQTDAGYFDLPMILMAFGRSLGFVPIQTWAMRDLSGSEIGQGSGMNNLARQLGGSAAIAVFTTMLEKWSASFHNVLLERCNLWDAAFQERMAVLSRLGDGISTRMVEKSVDLQAELLAYDRLFQVAAVVSLLLIALFFFMRKPVDGPAVDVDGGLEQA